MFQRYLVPIYLPRLFWFLGLSAFNESISKAEVKTPDDELQKFESRISPVQYFLASVVYKEDIACNYTISSAAWIVKDARYPETYVWLHQRQKLSCFFWELKEMFKRCCSSYYFHVLVSSTRALDLSVSGVYWTT